MAITSAHAKLTKVQLSDLVEQLQAEVQAKTAEISDLQQAASETPASGSPAAPTDFMVTGYLKSVTPVRTKEGAIVDNFFKVSVDTTAGVNFGTAENPKWDNITAKTAWFTTDGSVAESLLHLKEVNTWTAVRVWYRLSSNVKNVIHKPQLDYTTGAPLLGDDGNVKTQPGLKYAPDMRIAQVDIVAEKPVVASDDAQSDDYAF